MTGPSRPAAVVPGVVEIQVRDGLAPLSVPTTDDRAIRGRAGVLTGTEALLRRYPFLRAEPTFTISHDAADAARDRAAGRGIDAPHLGHFLTLHFADDVDTRRIAAELAALPEIQHAVAVPVAVPPVALPPSDGVPAADPMVGTSDQAVAGGPDGLENQWYLVRCRVPAAWTRATGAGVVVADVDFGCRTSHEELAGKITQTYNAFDDTSEVTQGPRVYHGTGVAALAAAATNGVGMSGVAPGAELWVVQAGDPPPSGPPYAGDPWARGIEWVRTTDSGGRRKVVILEVQSYGYHNYEQMPSVRAAIKTAAADDVVICVAAGNGDFDAGVDDSGDPFPETGSILVAATSYDPAVNRRASFSNYGPRIAVCAPGDSSHDVTAADTSDVAFRNPFGGTSGATPKVAGVVALMLEANPALTPDQVRRLLIASGRPPAEDLGHPIGTFLDADAAVRLATDSDLEDLMTDVDLSGDTNADGSWFPHKVVRKTGHAGPITFAPTHIAGVSFCMRLRSAANGKVFSDEVCWTPDDLAQKTLAVGVLANTRFTVDSRGTNEKTAFSGTLSFS